MPISFTEDHLWVEATQSSYAKCPASCPMNATCACDIKNSVKAHQCVCKAGYFMENDQCQSEFSQILCVGTQKS